SWHKILILTFPRSLFVMIYIYNAERAWIFLLQSLFNRTGRNYLLLELFYCCLCKLVGTCITTVPYSMSHRGRRSASSAILRTGITVIFVLQNIADVLSVTILQLIKPIKIMSRILFTIILFSLSFSVFAKSDLSKKEKAIVKSLKKQYKLESVEIERPYNGFVYYELLTKDFKRMIADSTGTVIIPQSRQITDAYLNRIRFICGHEKGLGNFRERGRNARTITAYYPGNQSVFLSSKSKGDGSSEYQFFSASGELLYSFDGTITEDINSPVYITKDLMGSYGLMAMDGRVLLPNEYSSIETRADGICILYQIQDGVERMGGTCVTNMTEDNVPCIFNYVEYSQSNGCWMVQVHEYDSIQPYHVDKQYDTTFMDEGQRLFEQQQYEKARKYYTISGSDAKWAKFYIGATYYKTIVRSFQDMNDAVSVLENSSNRQDRSIASDIRNDLKLFNEMAGKAEQAFQTYVESGHMKYTLKAKEMLYELSDMKSHTSGMESRVSMAVADLERRCAELDRMEQEEYNRRLEQQQLNLERQRLNEQRLAREQREREIRMRQRADAERRQREARKREEEKRRVQQNQQQQGQQQQRNTQQQRSSQQQQQTQRQQTQQPQKAEPPKKQIEQKIVLPKKVVPKVLNQELQK
ncbi:MAG: hypothetical protein IJS97_06080, partial [Prevotella sp.]|nr:hypothetical protein [Prevotella sp.]